MSGFGRSFNCFLVDFRFFRVMINHFIFPFMLFGIFRTVSLSIFGFGWKCCWECWFYFFVVE